VAKLLAGRCSHLLLVRRAAATPKVLPCSLCSATTTSDSHVAGQAVRRHHYTVLQAALPWPCAPAVVPTLQTRHRHPPWYWIVRTPLLVRASCPHPVPVHPSQEELAAHRPSTCAIQGCCAAPAATPSGEPAMSTSPEAMVATGACGPAPGALPPP
jgi:hypothetical protein